MSQIEAPADFLEAIETLRGHTFRRDVRVAQIPPPENIAPWAVALQAETDVPSIDSHLPYRAGSRFIVLYDPENIHMWGSPLRIVCHIGAPMDTTMASEELITQVAWSWLNEALDGRGARHMNLVGTVTRTQNSTFGGIDLRTSATELELRASWTPHGTDLSSHVLAWIDALSLVAGLAPEGTVLLIPRHSI
ncbi:DUF3000 domain-containing protein [Actinotignum urinale]|uniref:DUF3000 domain-containing protein n=1 Tax=Actinotignum urinale TaxID=190146 RepID=A0AAW9HNP1_9ACTO|nr:DUF3000 domain-containing protein [Actinotignum urinale]MDY5132166.1 DUF3000 domain-containing protein [Actinotignum urinale]MDY5155392.1 DUF3000 domain-containing protein [Actinotignum urinale]